MANPARTPSQGGNHPNAADVLAAVLDLGERMERRFEKVETEQRRQSDTLGKLDERQRKQGEDIAEVKGRVSQLPTIWQLAGLIFAIFGAAFVLIRFASGH